MGMRKIISIVLGIIIIAILVIMPFNLKEICYRHSIHQDWTLGAWNAVQISAALYSIVIGVLTLILVLLNVLKKSK